MNISKEDLLRINQGFGGNLRSNASIDFAFNKIEDSKTWRLQTTCLFIEGNIS